MAKLKNYEIANVATQLKQMGMGDYYISQIITSNLTVNYGWEAIDTARQMVRAGLGDAAIAAALISRDHTEPSRTFRSDFERFCWELDETAHQQRLDRIRRQKELEAARSRPVQRTYEEEVTSSVLSIIDGVFEIGGLLLSQRKKK